MLNEDFKTFCWIRSRKAPSKHSSAKLHRLWEKYLNLFTCKPWEGLPSYTLIARYFQSTQQNEKSSFHQTSFPIWTPPWHRVRSNVDEGGQSRKQELCLVWFYILWSLVCMLDLWSCVYDYVYIWIFLTNHDVYIFLANTWSLSV